MVLVLDNYDSFTFNLVQRLGALGAELDVRRNDEVDLDAVERLAPARIVISPGPGRPEDAGLSIPLVRRFAGRVPILGVCLGHQAIGAAFGGAIVRATRPMHGKTSPVAHNGLGLFAGLPSPLTVARYHSLVVDVASLPACLLTDAQVAGESTIMAVRHRDFPVFGVQFHPESVMSPEGDHLLARFLEA